MTDLLFTPHKLGRIELKNRLVMSPMTRSRAEGNVPNELMATYYGQRVEAGLIITEGTAPSPNGLGYPRIPGCFSAAQVEGWKKTTKAVHDGGSKIFLQLMHTGRVGHPHNLPTGGRLLAPSAVTAPGEMYTDQEGPKAHPAPEAMTEPEVEATLEEFVHASELAIEAGFDGVELHGANGYLIEQFLDTGSNLRTDSFGGSIENRARFGLEAARRCAAKIGKDRVGIRLSPYGVFNGMKPSDDTQALHVHLAKELDAIGVAYIHVVDHSAMGAPAVPAEVKKGIRENFHGTYILSGGYDRERAEAGLRAKEGDLVAFGRPFLSNPKLATKLKAGTALTAADMSTFYTPGPKGYTDYPA